MFTSISEIKSFNSCERKWKFSGRNALFLRPTTDKAAFRVGRAFHTAMELMYLERDINIDVIANNNDLTEADTEMLRFQVEQYYENVYLEDKDNMIIIDSELKYNIPLNKDVILFGYIDLVYLDKKDNTINILEHKFSRSFRSDFYNKVDEQLKAYELAVRYHYPDYRFGGVHVNEVRKLKTKFDHKRRKYQMSDNQLINFLKNLTDTTERMYTSDDEVKATPDFMKCDMCEYKDLCLKMEELGTNNVSVITEKDVRETGLRSLKK